MRSVPYIQNGDILAFYYKDGLDFFEILRAAKEKAEETEQDQFVCIEDGRLLCMYRVGRFNSRGEYLRGKFCYTLEGGELYDKLCKGDIACVP